MVAREPKNFVVYLTANDSGAFHIDYFNLLNMCRYDPGVAHIHLYVVISLAKKFTSLQKWIIESILQKVDKCKWITCEAVILKPNTGRDFSSLRQCLLGMKAKAEDDDFILVRNRSSRGPFMDQWYIKYIDQFYAHPDTGMVGSTINLNDHFVRGLKANASHVQSYVYLSRWKYFYPLLTDFPGIQAVTHHDAIIYGEIELSQRILRNGLRISSLQKPDMILDIDTQNAPVQQTYHPGLSFSELPIIHRKRDAQGLKLRLRQLSYIKILWLLLNKKDSTRFLDKGDADPS